MKREDSLIINGEHLDATRMYLGSDIINHINKIYEDMETETIEDVIRTLFGNGLISAEKYLSLTVKDYDSLNS